MILCRGDYAKSLNSNIFPGIQGGPLMHVIAAKAVAFKEALTPEFNAYQERIVKNANILAEELVKRGFRLVSGGTDNHMMLVDLTKTGLTGKVAEEALDKAGITVNKNTVPGETRSPFVTSGVRIGSPALTARGMKEKEFEIIANKIADVLDNINDEALHVKIKDEMKALASNFIIYDRPTY
jgi:glycine hydroxymethyltransferase